MRCSLAKQRMPKQAKSSTAKVRQICQEYPDKFLATPAGDSRCNLSDVLVKWDKKFFVESHRKSRQAADIPLHKLNINEAYGLLKNMKFDDDPCAIKDYIKKRLSNSDLETITNCTNLTIDPTSYALLQKAQPTSATVERSFSMMNKLLRKDKNFDVKNVKKYMMLYCNKKSLLLYGVAFVKNIIDRLLVYSTVAIVLNYFKIFYIKKR